MQWECCTKILILIVVKNIKNIYIKSTVVRNIEIYISCGSETLMSDYFVYLISVRRSVMRHFCKIKNVNITLQMAGDLQSTGKNFHFLFFLDSLSCYVNFLVETHVQRCLFFFPSESIVALVNDTGRKTFAHWLCMMLH